MNTCMILVNYIKNMYMKSSIFISSHIFSNLIFINEKSLSFI